MVQIWTLVRFRTDELETNEWASLESAARRAWTHTESCGRARRGVRGAPLSHRDKQATTKRALAVTARRDCVRRGGPPTVTCYSVTATSPVGPRSNIQFS